MGKDRWVLQETAEPPTLGKEVSVLRKLGLLFAAVFITTNLSALSFSVNDEIWKTQSSREISDLSYPVSIGSNLVSGIALDELFPIVFEAWSIEILSEGKIIKFTDPELGDSLGRTFLVKDNEDWSLLYKNRYFKSITSLNIACEILDSGPLEIWINWEGADLLRSEIKRYSDLHGIDIKITEVPKPDSKLVSVTQANGEVPDIIMVQSSYIDRLSRSGCIQNLDYFYPEGLVHQGREAFTHNGKIWAVPFYYDAQLFFFNPDIITKPDIDWDLSDLEELCYEAKQKGRIPSAWNSYSASFLIPFQMAFGKDSLIENDGSIIIDDAPTLNSLNYLLSLQNNGLMQPMERDAMTSLFVSGDVAMIISASYSIPHFQELGIPFEAAPLPVNSETGIRLSPLLDFKAFAIAKRSRNPIGARRLIEYMTGIGVQQRFTKATSKLPTLQAAGAVSANETPFFEALNISSDAGTVIPTEKAYSVYKNTMWKMLRFAISGRMPADQVLEKTQELVNKNLED